MVGKGYLLMQKTVDIFNIELVIKLPAWLILQEFYCFTSK